MQQSKSTASIAAVTNLFTQAVSKNEIGADAADIMVSGLNDTNILGCTGVDANDLDTDIVTIACLVIDGSYSMKDNEQVVREAYDELIIKAMKESKQAKDMLVSARIFDETEKVLYGFKKVADIGKIGSQYMAEGSATMLYEAAVNAMTATRAYAKTLNDSGVLTKCVVAILSDGRNNCGKFMSPDPVKKVAQDCIKSEMFYLVYVGFKADPADNLDAIGKSMGFPNVLTTTNNPHDVRAAMGLVSQSTIRKSQTTVGAPNSFFQ